jgi:hypothetical protein
MLAPGEYLVIPPTAPLPQEPSRKAAPRPAPAPPKPGGDDRTGDSFLMILLRALGAIHT